MQILVDAWILKKKATCYCVPEVTTGLRPGYDNGRMTDIN